MLRTWAVRLLRHEVDVVGQVLPGPGDAGHLRLAAELALGADLAGDARHLGGEGVELVDHRVDGVLQLQDFAAHVDGDLARQVAARHGGRHLRDVADLVGEVAAHGVHRVGEVLPGPGDAGNGRLAAELAVGADLARDARHLRGERAQLIDHRVDGFLELQDLAAHVDRDLFRQVAVGDRDRHLGDVAHLRRQVARHRVDAFGQVLPDARHLAHLRLAAKLAFGADLARHARDFRGEDAELLDHRVDDRGRAQELALQWAPVDIEPHGLQQVALGHRRDRPGDFRRRPEQVVDQGVDGILHLAPGAARASEVDALARPALAADDLADMLELLRYARIGRHDLVECIGDLAGDPGAVAAHANRKVADRHSLHRGQELVQLRYRAVTGRMRIGSGLERRAVGLGVGLGGWVDIGLHRASRPVRMNDRGTRRAAQAATQTILIGLGAPLAHMDHAGRCTNERRRRARHRRDLRPRRLLRRQIGDVRLVGQCLFAHISRIVMSTSSSVPEAKLTLQVL